MATLTPAKQRSPRNDELGTKHQQNTTRHILIGQTHTPSKRHRQIRTTQILSPHDRGRGVTFYESTTYPPSQGPSIHLNKIEYAILRGNTGEKQQLTDEITNAHRDGIWSKEALAIMQDSKHTINGKKISEPTIARLDNILREMLIKAINSNQPTRWVAHLSQEMTAAFDGPIYHTDPDNSSDTRTLWKPKVGTIATDGSHMPNTKTSGAGASAAFCTTNNKIQIYLCTVPGEQNSGPAEWAAVVYTLRSTDTTKDLIILVDLLSIINEIETWQEPASATRKALRPSYPHWFERATRLLQTRQGKVTFEHVSSQTAHETNTQTKIDKAFNEHTCHKQG
ncbi:hypothetical protein T492DRAFT_835691 [Pavlovales sp. CCMP2436]|nr:hypothetical protein T492DRAFT_835691 [Pavlovales sp. CCMP2436]